MRYAKLLTPLVVGSILSGCYHSTQLAATWRDPGTQRLAFHKPITVFVTKGETLRRTMEDKLAARFPNATPAYRVISSTDDGDNGMAIRQQLASAGYDGAIIMRVVRVDEVPNYVPGTYWGGAPYYSNFGGYWSNAWGYAYDPGYYTEDIIVSIETEIFSLTKDKLLWSARSETTNPRSINKLENSVIKHVFHALEKDGLISSVCNGSAQCVQTAEKDE